MSKPMTFKVEFVFNKKPLKIVETIMIKEYMKLRNIACDRLNSRYEAWNAKYSGSDDEYFAYIASCQEPILEQINREFQTLMTEIHSDEYSDLIAVNKFDKSLRMHVEIKPV